MRAVNRYARMILKKLGEMAKEAGGSIKIDNNGYDPRTGGIMPVSAEWISENQMSVAHYYEQNGDLMADPEIVFLLGSDGEYYPISYKQDSLGLEQSVIIEEKDGKKVYRYNISMQIDWAVFSGTWMRNIRDQQGLEVERAKHTPRAPVITKQSLINECIEQSEAMGREAYRRGIGAAPALDENFMGKLNAAHLSIGESIPYLQAWIKGWMAENLTAKALK